MDLPTPYHDGRIDKSIYHPRSVPEFGILALGKFKVFIITSTSKKRMLDLIDSSIGSH
jgi:hypothetical protein